VIITGKKESLDTDRVESPDVFQILVRLAGA